MFFVNVEAAVYKNNKWLIIRRSLKEGHAGGLLSLVGGTVENEGNSKDILERTLRRELFEEVGVKVTKKLEYLRNTSFVLEDGREVIDIVYLCEHEEGKPFAKSRDEIDAVYWMSSDEIYSNPDAPIWLIESIREAEARRVKTI
ncbi:NUDIX domain-containing protein [Bacillus sp. BGMRC 2118]|nr:NUDIX domain-containing protein [Bacillus sp. BGMRC 2118]